MMDMTPTQSESVADLTKALSKAQGAIENVTKASLNPHFRSKYADLASVREAINKALSAEGIAVTQPVVFDNGLVVVITEIALGDQWKRAPLGLPLQRQDAQSMGSMISYLRRYGLSSMLCLAAEDDDGEAATAGKLGAPVVEAGQISDEQATEIKRKIVEAGADIPKFLTTFQVERVEDLPVARFKEAVNKLGRKIEQARAAMPVEAAE